MDCSPTELYLKARVVRVLLSKTADRDITLISLLAIEDSLLGSADRKDINSIIFSQFLL